MTIDTTARETDLCALPGEFRENYLFLRELINCENQNNTLMADLEKLAQTPIAGLRGKLTRRQMDIIEDYLEILDQNEYEPFSPPVPPELEASIRVRRRTSWLPWEAEAIQKIKRWRTDVRSIVGQLDAILAKKTPKKISRIGLKSRART